LRRRRQNAYSKSTANVKSPVTGRSSTICHKSARHVYRQQRWTTICCSMMRAADSTRRPEFVARGGSSSNPPQGALGMCKSSW
jgi:hypothetical protein